MKIQTIFTPGVRWATISLSVALISMVYLANRATAQDVTLSNGGSSVTFNLGGGSDPIGMNNWMVDSDPGVNQLDQQWFWYSIYNGTTWSPVQPINQIGGLSSSISGSTLTATYQNSTLAVALQYTLTGTGGGSGGAILSESVNVLNLSSSSFDIDFWQYGHFNLLQHSDNTVNIGGSPGAYSFVSQSTTGGGNGMEETLNNPYANYAETGDPGTVMSDVAAGKQLNGTTAAGPGDEAWGLEWTDTDGSGDLWNVLQGENMSIQPAPEPATICLLGLGLSALGLARRSSKRKI
ncbi:MAG: PEP-CTERM sorting domain-containing protein [Limisphaerales bacterium]